MLKHKEDLYNFTCKSLLKEKANMFLIQDPLVRDVHNKKTYDLMGTHWNRPVLITHRMLTFAQSFNLSKEFDDREIENMLRFSREAKDALVIVILGVLYNRIDKRIFAFTDIETLANRRDVKQNYIKKELDVMPFCRVRNKEYSITDLVATNYIKEEE